MDIQKTSHENEVLAVSRDQSEKKLRSHEFSLHY